MIYNLSASNEPRRMSGNPAVIGAVLGALPVVFKTAKNIISCTTDCISDARKTHKQGAVKLPCLWSCVKTGGAPFHHPSQ